MKIPKRTTGLTALPEWLNTVTRPIRQKSNHPASQNQSRTGWESAVDDVASYARSSSSITPNSAPKASVRVRRSIPMQSPVCDFMQLAAQQHFSTGRHTGSSTAHGPLEAPQWSPPAVAASASADDMFT